jgi:type IV secretory pathway VirB2 component (pilin)
VLYYWRSKYCDGVISHLVICIAFIIPVQHKKAVLSGGVGNTEEQLVSKVRGPFQHIRALVPVIHDLITQLQSRCVAMKGSGNLLFLSI